MLVAVGRGGAESCSCLNIPFLAGGTRPGKLHPAFFSDGEAVVIHALTSTRC